MSNRSGKKIRPALFLIAAYRPGFDLKKLVGLAASFELLHIASLLHDDVIDQAETRRGQITVNSRWNNKIAVLTGDFILNQVFRKFTEYKEWHLINILVTIVTNLTEGELEQSFASIDLDNLEESYFSWIGKKSAAFFAGCCEAGSYISGVEKKTQWLWRDFGYNLGIAFQLTDDLLDFRGDMKTTGKPLYNDLRNGVITLPLIRAMERDGELRNTLRKDFLRLDADEEAMQKVVEIVLISDGLDYTSEIAANYAGRALEILDEIVFFERSAKIILQDLTLDMLKRKG